MNILITGGAGFIGSSLSKLFVNQGHNVTVIDDFSYGYESNLDDVKNKISLIHERVQDFDVNYCIDELDVIFHLAGISSLPANQEDPNKAIQNNLAGTANILELARKHPIQKFILASTGALYENTFVYPQTENAKIEPDLIYTLTKKWSEELVKSYFHNYGLPYTIVRYFNIYGTNQDINRKNPPLIGYLIRQILANEPIYVYSNGHQKRDYLHVEDLNKLHSKIVQNLNVENLTINACSNKQYSVNEIFAILKQYLPTNLVLNYLESADMWNKYDRLQDGRYVFSQKRVIQEVNKESLGSNFIAQKYFNWTPQIRFEDGIKQIVASL